MIASVSFDIVVLTIQNNAADATIGKPTLDMALTISCVSISVTPSKNITHYQPTREYDRNQKAESNSKVYVVHHS